MKKNIIADKVTSSRNQQFLKKQIMIYLKLITNFTSGNLESLLTRIKKFLFKMKFKVVLVITPLSENFKLPTKSEKCRNH